MPGKTLSCSITEAISVSDSLILFVKGFKETLPCHPTTSPLPCVLVMKSATIKMSDASQGVKMSVKVSRFGTWPWSGFPEVQSHGIYMSCLSLCCVLAAGGRCDPWTVFVYRLG